MSLEKFIARQKEINRNILIQEKHYHSRYYRFANDLDEADNETPAEEPAQEPAADAGAPAEPTNNQAQGGGQPAGDDGTQDMGPDASQETPADDVAGELDGNGNMDISLDDEDPAAGDAMGGDQDTEIDVTELVNGTQEVSQKVDGLVAKLDQQNANINNIIQSIGSIAPMLQNMQSAVNQLSHQVELMRPPTEEERRKVVKQTSYPFNQDINDFQNGVGPKTQTDMENRANSLSHENLMATYNDKEIKNSF
jgi:hypothetical protein